MKLFDEPIRPMELIAKASVIGALTNSPDSELIRAYQHSMFVAALVMFPNYRFFEWNDAERATLESLGSADRLADLSMELRERRLYEATERKYSISMIRIALWIKNNRIESGGEALS